MLTSAYFFANAQTKVIYTCPMHPQIKKDKPGNCPICGMTLVKKTVKVAPTKVVPKEPDKKQDEMKDMDMKKDTTKKMDMPMNDKKMPMDTVEGDIANQIQSKVYVQPGKTIRYDLYVKDTIVNFTGKSRRAIAVNGSIPAPTLIFTEGDTAEIYLHNMLNEETSFHWHGIILPNQADGVPFLTTAPVYPGQTHLYKFKVVQNGTYWYHSHSSLQEQA